MYFVPASGSLAHFFESEENFRQLYPRPVQQLDAMHWSPLSVIEKAAAFLAANKGAKILDIGSGSGKFCLAGSYYQSDAFFYGVEQRKNLVDHARHAAERSGMTRVQFVHKDFTRLDLTQFDHFYFYNSFFEHLVHTDKIDDSIAYDPGLYDYYSKYLYSQLKMMPAGTRVVTYCSWNEEIPPGYELIRTGLNNFLKFWIKK
ncbi:MAG TPA: methyltransferase domain-containing protein [Puia sp.]|jgi:cyclopropane fatty-acyl-phospholipid synthase-like methyltransferase|nr:methyltransferase domain-containing protein [Puia sp.]